MLDCIWNFLKPEFTEPPVTPCRSMVDEVGSIIYAIRRGMTLGCECKYKNDYHDYHENVCRCFDLVSITILFYVFDRDHGVCVTGYNGSPFWSVVADTFDNLFRVEHSD